MNYSCWSHPRAASGAAIFRERPTSIMKAALNDDETFKSADELAALYASHGVTADKGNDHLLRGWHPFGPYLVCA